MLTMCLNKMISYLIFVPVLHGYVCCYVGTKALLLCLYNTERWDMGLYEVPLFVSLLGFGIQLPCVMYYVLNILVRNAKRTYVF